MKNDIINRLIAVCGALDNVSVSGKSNLANLSGSIAMLEEVVGMLNNVEIVEAKEQKNDDGKARNDGKDK